MDAISTEAPSSPLSDELSRLRVVMDDEGEVIGVVRTIFGPYDELPVGQFERTDTSHPDPVCELSPDHALVADAVEAANQTPDPGAVTLVPRPHPSRTRQ